LLFTAIGSSWFYWFEWRPSKANRECFELIRTNLKKQDKQWDAINANRWFDFCLHSKGL